MRATIAIALSATLATLAVSGCVTSGPPPPPVVVPAPTDAAPEALRWAAEAALAERRWTVLQRSPGRIGAFVHSQGGGDEAVIEIAYGAGAVSIRCVKFHGDEYRYHRWVRLLASDIQKNVAMIGMGRAVPPPPPPEPAPAVPTEPLAPAAL
jgi:hypothetical protein